MEDQNSTIDFYTNNASLGIGAYDMVINFAHNTPDGVVQKKLRVTMSLQHGKKLAQALTEQIQLYEELYGTLNVEANPDALKRLSDDGKISLKDPGQSDEHEKS